MLGAIDSLTAGFGGSSYATDFTGHLRGIYGDGGGGYQAFTLTTPLDSGRVASASGRVAYLAGPTASPALERYSINGQGIDVVGGDGADYLYWSPNEGWDKVTIYYLQQPDGGTFQVGGYGAAAPVTVNTAGSLALKSVTVFSDRGQSNDDLRIDSISGHVTVFGGDFLQDDGGANFSNIAIGGTSMTNWAKLDPAFRRAWFAELQPDVYVLNGGMNDRGILTGDQYKTILNAILDDFAAASPTTQIVLVGANDIGSGGREYLAMFRQAMVEAANARGLIYIDDSAVLGSFASANAAGLMIDNIHPSAAGNELRSDALLQALGLNEAAPVATDAFLASGVQGLTYSATLASGAALPSWLAFDASTGQFRAVGTVPAGDIDIRVTATAADGSSASDVFRLHTVGNLTINGTSGGETLTGDVGADRINGLGGNDTLIGGDGADQLDGGAGADVLSGGDGNDFAIYTNSPTGVTVNLETRVGSGGDAEGDTYISIESVNGSAVQSNTLIGDARDNTLVGGGAGDSLVGGLGRDWLQGKAGNDTLDGGDGQDTAQYSGSKSQYSVSRSGGVITITDLRSGSPDGVDTVSNVEFFNFSDGTFSASTLGSGGQTITGTAGNDTLRGSGVTSDTLYGLGGDDALNSGAGADTMYGGAGNDTYYVKGLGDVVVEVAGEGTDTVNTLVSYTLTANVENLTILGSSAIDGTGNGLANSINGNGAANSLLGLDGADQLRGNDGDDTLDGGADNDYLSGGNGADILIGGTGSDTIYGGAGDDRFVFRTMADFGPASALDQIGDFNTAQGDKIDLSTIDANPNAAGVQGFTWLGVSAFTGAVGQLRYVKGSGGINTVQGDTNGDGAADFQFQVTAASLAATDFIFGSDPVQNDTTPPTVSLAANDTQLTSGETATVTLTFSEAVKGLDIADLVAANGTLSSLSQVDATRYSVIFTPAANYSGSGSLSLTAASYTDNAGNAGGGGQVGFTINTLAADTTPPTVTLSANDSQLTAGETATVTLTFSEAVKGFDAGDLSVSHGTIGGLTQIDVTRYSVVFTPQANYSGSGTLSLAASSYTDNAGNAGGGGQVGFTISTASSSGQTINGTAGNDTLRGSGVTNDTLYGFGGDDALNSGAGNDAMYGGTGNDTYYVKGAGDVVVELDGEGTDTVNAVVSYSLTANVENLTILGASAVNGTGNALANSINGNGAANIISGLEGADQLRGNDGDDLLDGGADNDYVSGGAGNDTVIGGTGTDTLYGGAGADSFVFRSVAEFGPASAQDQIGDFSTAQGDKIDLSAIDANPNAAGVQGFTWLGISAFSGSVGQLRYVKGSSGVNTVQGDLNGDGVADFQFQVTASSLAASDFIFGTDPVQGDTTPPTVNLAANDTQLTAGETSTVTFTFSEAIKGFELADLVASRGTLGSLSQIDATRYSVVFTPDANYSGSGSLSLTASSYTDTAGNAGGGAQVGFTINTVAADTTPPTVTLSANDSQLTAGETATVTLTFSEAIKGLDAGDLVASRGTIGGLTQIDSTRYSVIFTPQANYSGSGSLSLTASSYTDIAGNAGGAGQVAFTISTGSSGGAQTITGTSGNDSLRGSGVTNDTLYGLAGDDGLNSGAGNDTMYGGTGNDTYYVKGAGDLVIEQDGEGTDTVNALVSYTLTANVENLTILGTAAINGTGNALANVINGNGAANALSGADGADQLRGNDGDDLLDGGADNDYLSGGNGADTLIGGTGTDTLYGGAGADRFVFRSVSEFGPSAARDQIGDFSTAQGDKIDLSAIDANASASGVQGFTWLGLSAFTGASGELRYTTSGGTSIVSGDLNGDSVADFQLQVTSSSLAASDFIFAS